MKKPVTIAQHLLRHKFDVDIVAKKLGVKRKTVVTVLGRMRRRGQAPKGLSAVEASMAKRGVQALADLPEAVKPSARSETPCATFEAGPETGVLTTRSRDIRTLDQALLETKVDLTVWEVERYVVNSWEVTMSLQSAGTGKPETYTNFQVKAWLRRIRKTCSQRALEQVIAEGVQKVKLTQFPALAMKRPSLLEISLFDSHFGMYAWGDETGENYNLKVAEQRYLYAVEDLLRKTTGFDPAEIVFPLGNDFLHINDQTNETPAGHNRLDVDTRLPKVIKTAVGAVVRAVQLCAERAPVRLLWIPGNHDPQTSYFISLIVEAMFRGSKRVSVDTGPKPRKYVTFGNNLIGFTHGDEERHADLPTIMATDNARSFGACRTREWHVGHFHRRKETRFSAGDTFGGVVVRVLPSLSATDSWHFKKGYVNGSRAADAYLYDRDEGFIGHFTSWARTA